MIIWTKNCVKVIATQYMQANDEPAPSISGSGLTETFVLKQFHFHWGRKPDEGSEHQINGVSFSGEVRIMLRWNIYSSFLFPPCFNININIV